MCAYISKGEKMKQIIKLWRGYEEFWGWLVDRGQTKIGGYVLAFSFFIGMGLVIGLFLSEVIK